MSSLVLSNTRLSHNPTLRVLSYNIKLDRTHCYIEKFNIAFSLYEVLRVTLHFSENFLEATIEESVATEILQPLKVTKVCFLRQEFNL